MLHLPLSPACSMPAVLRGRKKACAAVLVGIGPCQTRRSSSAEHGGRGIDRGRRRGLLM
jgi:hypothetical protein